MDKALGGKAIHGKRTRGKIGIVKIVQQNLHQKMWSTADARTLGKGALRGRGEGKVMLNRA
jgi:hypothetical protein